LRVCTYNIWDGGGDRLGDIAEVLRSIDPSVVALLEVKDEAVAARLARELEMEHAFGEGNGDWHVAWLSRLPIRQARNHALPALAKTLLEVEVDGMRLYATHLASSHEAPRHPRAAELRAILGVLAACHVAHLLVGDFNALVPGEAIGVPPAGSVPRGDAAPGARRVVLDPLPVAGYVDCFRVLHPDEPGWTYPAASPWLRLDYVFASSDLAPTLAACEVADTEQARAASDHLPVWAEFRFPSGRAEQSPAEISHQDDAHG
jgi:endonuclease/exonuclease/phosphatase family metal-dependent hydrolase